MGGSHNSFINVAGNSTDYSVIHPIIPIKHA